MKARVTPQEGTLKLNGLRIHYLDYGGPDERPLVLVHGLRDYARYWDDQARRLTDAFHVYAYDQRGHGESDHAPGGYLVWALAEDLRAFVDALGLERFDLVGLSLGSRASMAFAREHSARIRRLVLVDMGPEMARAGAQGIQQSMTAPRSERTGPPGYANEEEALAAFRRQWPALDDETLRGHVRNALTPNEEGRLVRRYDRRLADITGRSAIVEIPFLWGSLERIACPTLVIRGEHSEILSREIAERMLAALPDGRLVEVPGTGHQLVMEQPEAFARALREFLLS